MQVTRGAAAWPPVYGPGAGRIAGVVSPARRSTCAPSLPDDRLDDLALLVGQRFVDGVLAVPTALVDPFDVG